jgi:hypothetical protein
MSTFEKASRGDLIAAVDRYGADLSRWPDRELASRARAAAHADRAFRGRLDRQAALERRLDAARAAEDAAIEASGAAGRVAAAVAASVGEVQPRRRRRLMAAAAAILIAAGIGGVVDSQIALNSSGGSFDVVSIDPLVFGPLDTDVE